MPNKREFKKYADALGASIIDEMISAYYNVKDVDRDKVAKAMELVLGAIGKAKNNSNITFDKSARAFESPQDYSVAKRNFYRSLFDKIETEFNEEINQSLHEFNSALPQDEKLRNKESAIQ